MLNQTRKRLSSTVEMSLAAKSVREANKFLQKYPIPRLLDRKRWSKKRREHHEEAWTELDQDRRLTLRLRQRHQALAETLSRIRLKRIRHHKILRELRRSERRDLLDNRVGRKMHRTRIEQEHGDQILAALHNGATTIGQVCKETGLETRAARRCLRKLVQDDVVEKPSSRQYHLTETKQRKRLADVQPTKRRKRLTKKSKAR